MTRSLSVLACVTLLAAFSAAPMSAQARLSPRERVQFTAPSEALDSTTIQLRVLDAATGQPVPALICFYGGDEVVTDVAGNVRVVNLIRRNVPTKVMARGYRSEGLLFMPGKLGRSNATVRLEATPGDTAIPTCAQAEWPE